MRFFYLIICGCLLVSPALKASDELHLYTEHFPPYNFAENEQVVGINTELVRRACALAKLNCQFTLYPWLRSFEYALGDPIGGVYTTALTPERRQLFHWVGPLASSRSYLYRLKSRSEISPKTLDEAKQFGIAVAAGDIYEEYFMQRGFVRGKNLLDFPSKSAPIRLFLKGKVDLVVGSELVMPSWLASHRVTMDAVEPVLELENLGQNYLALNRKIPVSIVQRLQSAMLQLKASGEYQQIVANRSGLYPK